MFFFGSHFLPKLNFFVPFLCIAYYRLPFLSCLWLSFFCGLVFDCFSFHHTFGSFALNYCLCTALLYSKKIHFFREHFSTTPLLSMLFSILSSLVHIFLFRIFSQSFPIQLLGFHILYLALLDGLYAFFFFSLPKVLWNTLPKKRKAFTLKRPQ